MESSYLQVIRLWAAMAWADGKVVKQEKAALERLIAGAQLSDGERAVALGFLDQRVELDSAVPKSLSPEAKEGVYRAACKLSTIDKDVAEAERAFLAKLRAALAIDAAAAAKIEAAVGL
jgi:uncharacterized membrane protein YebE (DUF533 family)